MAGLDRLQPGAALGLDALLAAANPKNGALTIAAAASIASAAAVMVVLFGVFGVQLVGDGIAVLF
jgi:hypothetical protein